MTLERHGEDLRALDTQVHAATLDVRDRRLRDAGAFGELVLAQPLKLPDDANGLSDGDLDALPWHGGGPGGSGATPSRHRVERGRGTRR